MFTKRAPIRQTLTLAVEQTKKATTDFISELSTNCDNLNKVTNELIALAEVEQSSIEPEDCGYHALLIVKKQDEVVRAIRDIPIQTSVTVFWEAAIPSLFGLEERYQRRYNAWNEAQTEERERKKRAKAFAKDEAFEENLRSRLRAGEDIDVEAERRRRKSPPVGGLHC